MSWVLCVVDMSAAMSRTLASDPWENGKIFPQGDGKTFHVQMLTDCAESIYCSFLLRDAPHSCS